MNIETNDEYAYSVLRKFLDTTTENITVSATVNRALIDKISTEIISTKVSNQSNSIQASIHKINPKFNEKSKHYDIVNKEITDALADYETILKKYSDKFDTQLEELLLKKVELESDLIGKIFKEEKFKNDENNKTKEKQDDRLKVALEEKRKKIFEFISRNKKENKMDLQDVRKLEDSFDVEEEQTNKLNKRIEKIQEENKTNMAEIAKIENDIKSINRKINELNEKKRMSLEEAMETKDKWVTKTLKKPSTFSKITKFFSTRFNTYKVIESSVIEPFKNRISEFKIAENN